MESLKTILWKIHTVLDAPLFTLGKNPFTLWKIIYITLLLLTLFFLASRLKRVIAKRLLVKSAMELGTREAIAALTQYAVIIAGFFIILQTVGIDLSALTVLMGTLGIGIGFGLQHVTSNMVSGIVILLERPIKVGDRVEVGSVRGDVINISLRSTTVLSNDNVAIIVPNSEFTTTRVTNWSYTNADVRLEFPVGVAYGSDPNLVQKVMLEVADEHPGVLKQPEPDVLLVSFGDSSLNFLLRAWTRDYTHRPGKLRSDINFALLRKFDEYGIEIPFPQRDIHVRTLP
jgi:small-conductance mechanosensitive channel